MKFLTFPVVSAEVIEGIGLLGVLLDLTSWLAFFWHVAHTQPATIEPVGSAIVYPWERTDRTYRIEGP
jgi:hypothetical protein